RGHSRLDRSARGKACPMARGEGGRKEGARGSGPLHGVSDSSTPHEWRRVRVSRCPAAVSAAKHQRQGLETVSHGKQYSSTGIEPLSPSEVREYYAARMPDDLRMSGGQWRVRCPLHSGKGFNFAIDPETGQWFCHSECVRGGDVFELELLLNGGTFRDAK